MHRVERSWIRVLGLVVVAMAGCTNSDIDDPDLANSFLQIVTLDNPAVSGDTQVGACSISATECLDDTDCPDTEVCLIDPLGADCLIVEWSATLNNVPKSDLGASSPFNDIALEEVVVTYDWVNGFVMDPLHVPLAGTVPSGGTASVAFFPISGEDLAALRAAFPLVTRTANVTMEFRGHGEEGSDTSVEAGAQLFVEACN